MDIQEIISSINQSRAAFNRVEIEHSPGLYVFFLNDVTKLHPDFEEPFEIVLYAGSSSDLADREFDTHFESGKSGFSTLRRSLGAILKEKLELTAYPRSPGSSKTNVRNYIFNDDGEERLTIWMITNLEVGVFPVKDYKDIEKRLINELKPLLNLTHWENPHRDYIKKLRKVCADEAQKNRVSF